MPGKFEEFTFTSQAIDHPLTARLYVPEKIGATTGLTTLIHGWGCDRQQFDHLAEFCAAADLLSVQVEYRGSGRETRGGRYDIPYEFGKLQVIDTLRAVQATLDRYPLNRRRLFLIGGSGGGHNVLQAAAFAPHTFALSVALAPVCRPTNRGDVEQGGYSTDPRPRDGKEFGLDMNLGWGFEGCALGDAEYFTPNEWDIRNCQRPDHVAAIQCKVILIHGTADATVAPRHSLDMTQALLNGGKRVSLHLIDGGDHDVALSFKNEEFPLGGLLEQYARRDLLSLQTDGVTDFERRETVDLGRWQIAYPDGLPELGEKR